MTQNEFKDTEIGKIPVDWEVVELGELVTFQRGHDLPVNFRETGIYPVVASNGIVGYHNEYKVENEGLTIGRSGNLGEPFYVSTSFWPLNTTLYVKKFHDSHPKFMYYLLKTLDLKKYNSGSAVPSLNRNYIHPIKVAVPKFQEQEKIAQILSALDDKIENNNEQNKILEETANSIFKEWFVEFNFLDEDGLPYFKNGRKMEFNEELGIEIPKGWGFKELSEFGKIVCGKTPSKSVIEYFCGETPFIKIPDMHNKMFLVKTEDSLTEKGVQSQKNKVIPANSVCVSCIATVGLVSITTKESQTNQQINSIIPKNDNLTIYLYFTLKSIIDYIKILAGGGSATLNLNTTEFSKIKIIMPEKDILKKYHEKMEPLKNKILNNEMENQTLSNLRDLLLPKLISGEIRLN